MRSALLSLLLIALKGSATELLDRNLVYKSPFVYDHPEVYIYIPRFLRGSCSEITAIS